MIGVEVITYFFLSFIYFFGKIIYFYLKKISFIKIIVYVLLLISNLIKFLYNFQIIKYASICAYIYFIFKIYDKCSELSYVNKFWDAKMSLNFKVNYRLLQAHYYILRKEPKYKRSIILFFIGFKLKILVSILSLKYIGLISCFGVLYAQLKFYVYIIDSWNFLNTQLMRDKDFFYIKLSIPFQYKKHMVSAYVVFFISVLESIVLIVTYLMQ